MGRQPINTALHIPVRGAQPRAIGAALVRVARRDRATAIRDLRQSGSLKLLFPRTTGPKTAVLLNTAGGVTGGDRFDFSTQIGKDSHLVLTTQAAERAYRAQPGETGTIRNRITIESGARCDWLPQETILFDGAALNRQLRVDMTSQSRFLMVEPVIFGRAAMGERVRNLQFSDRIDLRRDGELIYADRTSLNGDAETILTPAATGGGCGAMASVLLASQDAERHLADARSALPETAGISLIRDGLLFARLLAKDGFSLRQTLIPLLRLLGANDLPRTWTL